MCGISGVISRASLAEDDLDVLLSSIKHRGPDATYKENINLNGFSGSIGMVRLAIIDLLGGIQPKSSKNSLLVFNGEIYNYRELSVLLRSRGVILSDDSDTEVVFKGLEEFGLEFLKMMRGMFAIFYLNRKEKKGYLIRDFFGEKPLFYSITKRSLIFSSEIKTLAKSKNYRIKKENLRNYFSYGACLDGETLFEEVRTVKRSSFVEIDFSKSYLTYSERFYQPQNHDELAFSLDLMDKVILEKTNSDVPMALFLSGGLDSAIILETLSRRKIDIVAVTIGFEDSKGHEIDRAKMLCNFYDMKHKVVMCSKKEFVDSAVSFITTQDILVSDPAMLGVDLLSKHTCEQFKVALVGDGGDEMFRGYRRHIVQDALEIIRNSLILRQISLAISKFVTSWRWKALLRFDYSVLSKRFHNLNSTVVRDDDISRLLPSYLCMKSDYSSMKNSQELRSIFLDKRLYDLNLRGYGNRKKRQFKRLYGRLLPKGYFKMPKKGFDVPLDDILNDDRILGLTKSMKKNEYFIAMLKEYGLSVDNSTSLEKYNLIVLWCFLENIDYSWTS